MDHNTSNPEKSDTDGNSKINSRWSILEKMADKYDTAERSRIDQLKDNLRDDPFGEPSRYQYEQIGIRPSTLRKIGRLALDRLGIHFGRSETRRRREAMAVAVQEYDAEQGQRELERQRHLEEQKTEYKRREAEHKATEAAREKAAFERDFINGMDRYRRQKQERFQKQRVQEQIEQDLNRRLLTVDSLEDEILAENPEVEKTTRTYQDTEIPIYTLKGIPFSMISHDLDYRKVDSGDPDHIGAQTSKRLVESPDIWVQNESEAMQDDGFGTRGGNARGNVISVSYINSESNLDSRVSNTGSHADLCYGFSNVDSGGLLYASQGDGGTPNVVGKDTETLLDKSDLQVIDSLEGASNRPDYNELLMRRYSETGEARRPDYIIAENGKLTEDMLRHAAFFSIPIINIDKAAYTEKMKSRAVEALNSINENSTYEEINSAIDKIKTTSEYNSRMKVETSIGRGRDKQNFEYRYRRHDKYHKDDEIGKKIIDLGKLEIEKRIDFIVSELQKATEACRQATSEGREYHFSSDLIEQIYQCNVLDNQNNKRYTTDGEFSGLGILPASPNVITFNFRMKGGTRTINTEIIDGERRTITEENKEDVEDSDSSYYNKVYPFIMDYMAAERENQEMLARQNS